MIAIDLSKQQALDVDLKAIKQINFAENLEQEGQKALFFLIEKVTETILNFS